MLPVNKEQYDRYHDFSELEEVVEGFHSGTQGTIEHTIATQVQKSLIRKNPTVGLLELVAFNTATKSFNDIEIVKSLRLIIRLIVGVIILLSFIAYQLASS